jgi:hypothetical protein
MDGTRTSGSEQHVSGRWPRMKSLFVIGLFLDLVGVVILGMRDVMKGAASLRSLRESYKDSFDYDVQQRTWSARLLLVLGATLGAAMSGARREPTPYRAFPLTVCGFFLLIVGFLLQLLAALWGVIRTSP